jgi:hypothetical protein
MGTLAPIQNRYHCHPTSPNYSYFNCSLAFICESSLFFGPLFLQHKQEAGNVVDQTVGAIRTVRHSHQFRNIE